MKGSANAAWNGVVKPSGPIKKYGGRVKNRRGGAPGGARAGNTARGRLREVPSLTCAVPALRSLMVEGEEMKAQAPRRPPKGPMNHAHT
jgi:hypothetical protein